jgi:hypothetical protein
VSLRGALLVWIGLMGLAATAAVFVLLRLFPRAFSDAGPAVTLPWRRDTVRAVRARGWLLLAAALVSAVVAIAGVVSLLA